MLNDTYIEVMVRGKVSVLRKVVQIALAAMTASALWLTLTGALFAAIFAIMFGAIYYYVARGAYVEYEYIYVDKELQIDRISGKIKRKRMETLDLQQMEVLAPIGSHELDRYKERKQKDYSSLGKEKKNKYVLVHNEQQIIFEPTEEMIKTIRTIAPRRVFTY